MGSNGKKTTTGAETCFVIMPISDSEQYEKGHFKYVYEDLFRPAIEAAGYVPKRADDDRSSSMIQVNIIKDIIEAPMAICDLSTRNPNVLFELGIRQAFDLPVVLVQEEGTPRIFDISTINTIDYRKNLIYREVMEDREKIADAIKATAKNNKLNSIIKLLDITKKAELNSSANVDDNDEIKLLLMGISNQLSQLQNAKKTPSKIELVYPLDSFFINSNSELTNNQKSKILEYLFNMTSTVRVYEIAKEANADTNLVVAYLKDFGAKIENHMSKVTMSERNKILENITAKTM